MWYDFTKKSRQDKEGGIFPPSRGKSGKPAFDLPTAKNLAIDS